MLMCIQNLVKFCPSVLKILSGNENYDGMMELQKDGIKELQKDIQGKSSIAPLFQSGAIIRKPACRSQTKPMSSMCMYVCIKTQV